jgi:two-component sensor histidine kinase
MAMPNRPELAFPANALVVPNYRCFPELAEGRALAKAFVEASHQPTLIRDRTPRASERSAAEREMAELLHQKDVLLREAQHRMANSLQIIASILQLKARNVDSEETRRHLKDAHRRIMAVATVQQHLDISRQGGGIELAPYLSRLCDSLSASLVEDPRVAIKVQADGGMVTSAEAVSIGLIVTELVINALKHAFVGDEAAGRIVVAYQTAGPKWQLTVSDNGVGTTGGQAGRAPGLGASIVAALARQLDARVDISGTSSGTTVSITR